MDEQLAEKLSQDEGELVPGPSESDPEATLVEMGIPRAWAHFALEECKGDVVPAIDFCCCQDMAKLMEDRQQTTPAVALDSADADLALAVALQEQEDMEARRSIHARARSLQQQYGGGGAHVKVRVIPAGLQNGTEQKEIFGDNEEDEEEEDDFSDNIIQPSGNRRRPRDLRRRNDGSLVSKHDAEICGLSNAAKLSLLEGVGDLTHESKIKLSNSALNSVKRKIQGQRQKGVTASGRVEAQTRATREGVLDPRTRLMLYALVNRGVLQTVQAAIKTGKEASVYHGIAGCDLTEWASNPVAIKVFRTTLNEFSNRGDYVDDDARYARLGRDFRFNKQGRRAFTLWAMKEFANLTRMWRAGIPCPQPFLAKEHILIMSFIGKDGWPAPQLREVTLNAKIQWVRCYAQVMDIMRRMFQQCKLVHADLSPYNILLASDRVCYVIDVGQAVDLSHPMADEFLRRDVKIISDFFSSKDVSVLHEESALMWIKLYTPVSGYDTLFNTMISCADEAEVALRIQGLIEENQPSAISSEEASQVAEVARSCRDQKKPITSFTFV
jgi:RIO kinase 3